MNHYFVYKNPFDAAEGHIEISGEEFYRVTQENNLRPKSQRRVFIRYDALDERDHSRMYWEVTREERNLWRRSERVFARHNASLYGDERMVSLDDMTDEEAAVQSGHFSFGVSVDEAAESSIFMEQLFDRLEGHEDWADMVVMYVNGLRHKCASRLAPEYGKCERTIRNWQARLDEILKEFAADWL